MIERPGSLVLISAGARRTSTENRGRHGGCIRCEARSVEGRIPSADATSYGQPDGRRFNLSAADGRAGDPHEEMGKEAGKSAELAIVILSGVHDSSARRSRESPGGSKQSRQETQV